MLNQSFARHCQYHMLYNEQLRPSTTEKVELGEWATPMAHVPKNDGTLHTHAKTTQLPLTENLTFLSVKSVYWWMSLLSCVLINNFQRTLPVSSFSLLTHIVAYIATYYSLSCHSQ